ncbi:MAG: FAD:protein FMN transferase [Nitrospirota bacterium]
MKQCGIMVIALLTLVSGCTEPRTVQKTETIMGTQVSITVVAQTAEQGEAAIEAGMAEVRRFDAMMSLYKDDSEITRLNLAAGKQPVRVSPEMIEAVEQAAEISRRSGGVFDVTIGPLVVLWQMRLKEGKIPSDEEISRVRPRVNFRNISINKKDSTIFLKRSGMIMDLGGMKGYIADQVAGLIKRRGITNALIALAGDIWALGHREDGKPWRIGVQHPREKDRTLAVLELSDQYVCTSGDYERFIIKEKKRYHHIIDPRTGKPSTGVVSVTLVGKKGALIDPLAKVPFILGVEKGLGLIREYGAEAIIVDDQGKVTSTAGIVLL